MLKPSEMAELLGVTVRTLQTWDRRGKLIAHRTPSNRRYYTQEQYLSYIGKSDENLRKQIAYARVSNVGQKDDLANQEAFLRQYVNGKGIILDEFISDIGSGLNYKRKKWNKLLDEVMKGEVDTIYVTYKDRFVRFGFDWFEQFCSKFDTKLEVLNNPKTSPEKELVEDLISIIHVFSCRIYGLRKYKKKIEGDKGVNSL
ncbi:MAG: IS607 family transposase [Streptococcaceae bacterium]|nr:IS607 family transposase [Streptococcaceae bacterium]